VASRRLYRIRQGKQLAGVCNGLAAYFEVDPSWVRIGFLVFGLCWGLTVLVYLALVLILPVARTPQELAAAYGGIRQAREPWHRAPSGSMARVLAALLMLPLLLVFGGLAIAWIIALFVLITTGTLFGLFLPLTIPLWVTVLLLLMLFGIVTWPLRIVAQLLSSSSHHAGSGVFSFLENLVGIAALCALGYWAYHHVPAVSYWINELRNQLPMVLDPSTST
jgi:phage shock protein PspC (stress-responsive transcriptional regulator)